MARLQHAVSIDVRIEIVLQCIRAGSRALVGAKSLLYALLSVLSMATYRALRPAGASRI